MNLQIFRSLNVYRIPQISKYRFALWLGSLSCSLYAQNENNLAGRVKDELGKGIPEVVVAIEKTSFSTTTNDSGYFMLNIPANKSEILVFSRVGYLQQRKTVQTTTGIKQQIEVMMAYSTSIKEVTVKSDGDRMSGISKLDVKDFNDMPNVNGNFESMLKTLPGVASANELSTQYSVRGGSFDENLVYVNDIEVYRPYLIRSGQQEGLSFINSDMVSGVKFSAGGFESRYGDKMASVLDVTYKKPVGFACSANASLLGGGVTVENVSLNNKLSYIGGIRYKTSRYLLSSLQTEGEYSPSSTDFQSQINYQLSKDLELGFLGNFAQNSYLFMPETRSTNFGPTTQMYNLTVAYEGREKDLYRSITSAFTVNYKPSEKLSLKLISSAYSSYEQETFDIDGWYSINELDNTAGSTTYGDSLINLGAAGMLNHARNYLWNNTYTATHIGTFAIAEHTLKWSLAYKYEDIDSRQNEWSILDSSGYVMPYSIAGISTFDYASGKYQLGITTYSGYLQDSWQFDAASARCLLTGGLRFNYRDYSNQLLWSPRLRFSVKPSWNRDMVFFVACGSYQQPPSIKEMRNMQGVLNPNVKAQESYHFVVGSDYNFSMWNRPFKFTSELYYKYLNNLIPYKINNVRTEYTAENSAKGYIGGIDLKVNGEFVPGIESWAGLSVLKAMQDIKNDYYIDDNGNRIEPGYFPTPTDQRVTFNLFFQDYLPNNPSFQMHMALAYGSGFQLSPPRTERFDKTLSLGAYRRVDIGFSKVFKADAVEGKRWKEFVISLEVFNLLDINNESSYLWIRTVPNSDNQTSVFYIPNYLTSRRINLKLTAKF